MYVLLFLPAFRQQEEEKAVEKGEKRHAVLAFQRVVGKHGKQKDEQEGQV